MKTIFHCILLSITVQSVLANPYYRDGDGDGSPSYPLLVDASDADGDLMEVTLWMSNSFDQPSETQIAENLTASPTGEATMVINYTNVLNGPPGTRYEYRARGIDLTGRTAEVIGTLTVADRWPTARFDSAVFASGPPRIDLEISADGNDDFDLDYGELFVRRKDFSETTFTEPWTIIELDNLPGTGTVVVSGARVSGSRLRTVGEVDEFQATLSYIPASRGDYQFRWVLTDKPGGAGALSVIAPSPVVRFGQKIQLRSVAYPKQGYEAWFETSDMAVEEYDLN